MSYQRHPTNRSTPWRLSVGLDDLEISPFCDESHDSVHQFLLQNISSRDIDHQQNSDGYHSPPSDFQSQSKTIDQEKNTNFGPYSRSIDFVSTTSTLVPADSHDQNGPRSNENRLLSGGFVSDPDDKAPKNSIRRTKLKLQKPVSAWKIWRMETISTLLAFCCIIFVIAILLVYQDKTLDCQPKMISINALISIFSSVLKAALIMPVAEGLAQLKWGWFSQSQKLSDVTLFDAASRGPWGSFKFVAKKCFHINECFLPYLGSLIVIAALAIEPITQSLVEHTVCSDELSSGIATVARTNNYSKYPSGIQGGQIYYEAYLDSSMQAAIIKGLVESQTTSSLIDVSCEQGNCTFGAKGDGGFFSSLAVCHSCNDISDTIRKDPADKFGYSLSSGVKLNKTTALKGNVNMPDNHFNRTFKFEALMLKFSPGVGNVSGAFAVGCTIVPCVKRYSGIVKNQIYSEFEESSTEFADNLSTIGVKDSMVTNSTLIDGKWIGCTPSRKPSDIGPSAIKTATDEKGPIFYRQECVWGVDYRSWLSIWHCLGVLLNGTLATPEKDQTPENTMGAMWLKNIFSDGKGHLEATDQLFEGLTSSITAAMRNRPVNGNGPLTKARGTAYKVTTCLTVHWQWISYPAALFILQMIFCAIMLWTRHWAVADDFRIRGDWKSSPLALLFYGMEENLRLRLGNLATVEEMEEVAAMTDVKLCRVDDENGQPDWRFCES